MTEREYVNELIKILKENSEDFKEFPSDIPMTIPQLLTLIANHTEVTQVPTIDKKDLKPIKLKQECKQVLKKLGLRKVNKLADALYLATLKTLETGDLTYFKDKLESSMQYVDPMKFFKMMPKELLKEFTKVLEDEELQKELLDEFDGSLMDREVQTEDAGGSSSSGSGETEDQGVPAK